MGTSLSGLTPATTFDGLLKTSDNEPLDGTLKAISTGDGTDTMLELSTTALQIGGATGMYWDNTNKRLGINNTSPAAALDVNGNVLFTGGSGTYPFDVLPSGGLRFQTSSGSVRQISNFLKLSGTTGVQIFSNTIVGEESTPAARLQVKGSGTTSATTSLLVQNSAGGNIIKANDDGRVLLGVNTDYQNHLLELNGEGLGDSQTLLRLQSSVNFMGAYTGIGFTNSTNGSSLSSEIRAYRESYGNAMTFNFAGTEMLRATSEGNLGIGETTPTARLHVKGSGNDNTTTSLLVQNSDGADVLQTLDNGSVGIGGPAASQYRVTMTSGVLRLKDLLFGQSGNAAINNTSLLTMKWNGSTGIGISGGGAIDATARLHIKGSGTTSATTSLLVQNSAGNQLLKVDDGRNVYLGDSNNYIHRGAVFQGNYSAVGNWNFGTISDFAARFGIKGSGNDATTTALLVQNSDGDDMLKVTDDRNIETYDATGNVISQNDAATSTFVINPSLTSDVDFRVAGGGGKVNLLKVDSGLNSVSIGTGGVANTRFVIKGDGTTSATTALLVQNSAGTDLLKVDDDGGIITSRFDLSKSDNSIIPYIGGSLGKKYSTNNHFSNAYLKGYVHITNNAVSDTTYNASAKLQVDSTTQGFLPPRMTTTERDAITTPAAGLMVYNTTTNKAQCYNGSTWNDLF